MLVYRGILGYHEETPGVVYESICSPDWMTMGK